MLEMQTVPMEVPADTNIVVGQSHFIKTVEDLYNLGGIDARHQDPAVAQEYLQKAVGWDPTLRAAQRP